ncbi:Uncharacterised protein (plasmid) [Mesomycoplasma neurolyticum]|uniref:Uncharacterized protein n=1 Tax=Mesomycoplasma neurolyticum TaxID=2120 RepID=A0A449A5G5_9BACT|nr:Uncharacterised protein [Mesomycoplasma neurolyticum]VEU59883.1 Uncharacterised protein [Mesomycoplasma neurolyticum]
MYQSFVLVVPIFFLINSLIYYFKKIKKNKSIYTKKQLYKKLYILLAINSIAWVLAIAHLLNLI